jgi:hypothetical protein
MPVWKFSQEEDRKKNKAGLSTAANVGMAVLILAS